MIGDYLVAALVVGIVGSFVAIIYHFWSRDVFKEAAQQSGPAKDESTRGNLSLEAFSASEITRIVINADARRCW